jgi:hypothetical protein
VFTPDTVLDLISMARVVTHQDAITPFHESVADTSAAAEAAATILNLGAEALRRASFFPSLEDQSPMAQNMNKCVQLAAKICRNLLLLRAARAEPNTSSPSPSPTTTSIISRNTPITPIITSTIPISSATKLQPLHDEISLLKATLPKIEFISWLQHAPEAYVWVCFTAAAASAASAALHCRDEEGTGGDENDDWTSFILTPMPVITATDSAELRLLREGWAYLRWLRGKY